MAHVVTMYDARIRIEGTRWTNRHIRRIVDDVHIHAVAGATGGKYSTGRLASSIYKRVTIPFVLRSVGEVGSKLPYAASVERGASVHNIFPKGAAHVLRFGGVSRDGRRVQFGIGTGQRKMLRFYWRGSYIVTPHVPMSPRTIGLSHPGQRGKHFLLKALVRASAKYRMRLTINNI